MMLGVNRPSNEQPASEPIVRRYEPRDLEDVLRLNRTALIDAGVTPHSEEFDSDLRDIEGSYLSGGGEFLVAHAASEIVGMGALRHHSARAGEIKRMRVAKSHRRLGLASSILARLAKAAIRHGYQRLVLDVSTELVAAQRFYESHNFVLRDRGSLDGHECLFYEKPL